MKMAVPPILQDELGDDGWKAWVISIHRNLSMYPVPIRLHDASFDALAETVEGSLVELMETSVLCAVHRLHGASHDGDPFDADVPNPFLPTVGAADVNLAYTMRHGRGIDKELHHALSNQFRFFPDDAAADQEKEAYSLKVRAHGFHPCTDLHYALRRLAYRGGIAKITAKAFDFFSLALIAKILDVVGVARFSTAHHRQHPNLSSVCMRHPVAGYDNEDDDEYSISETSEESGNEDSDETEDSDEDEDEIEEEWYELEEGKQVKTKGTYIRASDIVAAAARSKANLKQPLFL